MNSLSSDRVLGNIFTPTSAEIIFRNQPAFSDLEAEAAKMLDANQALRIFA